jgi:hypothetical protein
MKRSTIIDSIVFVLFSAATIATINVVSNEYNKVSSIAPVIITAEPSTIVFESSVHVFGTTASKSNQKSVRSHSTRGNKHVSSKVWTCGPFHPISTGGSVRDCVWK